MWSIRAPAGLRSGAVVRRGRRAPTARAGARLRLLFLFLAGGTRRVLGLRLVHALLELLHARPQRARQLWQAIGAEQHEHDHQDDEKFLISETKHGGSFRDTLNLSTDFQPPRKTLRSPTRAVTRRVSKNSSNGIAYFREMPSRSLTSPGPISFRSRSSATSFSWIASSASV